ncbi:MAG: Threonine synthase [Clostridiales bacterium 38_11]|nr:MAG: Threonine synthase [Clostridiales bacterium 38_11]HBH13430.1 threonine synthase [Clostridiales bacterium]
MTDYRLKCISCEKEYEPERSLYYCQECGPLLGTLEVIYDYDKIKIGHSFSKNAGITQFKDLLPVNFQTNMDSFVGGTPLIKLRKIFGTDEMMIKFDGVSMSGSYKDRASIIAINKAMEYGFDTIFCASTGNAASSLAILSAHTRLKTYIFVPSTIPKGKLVQLIAAGAIVLPLIGTYDEAFDISMDIGLKKGWYCRNSAINPYLLEGKKTGAYEIIVQNDYKVPDFCFVSVGDGTVVSSLFKGFMEFERLGITDRMPRIIGVQAEGASTLKKVFEKGKPYTPIEEKVHTLADSISVGNPRDVIKACKYMEKYEGELISVSDEEILQGIMMLGSTTGVFSEPAGAAAFAGYQKMMGDGRIASRQSVCLVITGNGLKDIHAVENAVNVNNYKKEEIYNILEGGLI